MDTSNKFITNINTYLNVFHIKHKYIEVLTGWDRNKVSRILNKAQDLKLSEADILAQSLGKDVTYFLEDPYHFKLHTERDYRNATIRYPNLPKHEQKVAYQLEELFRYYDALVNLKL